MIQARQITVTTTPTRLTSGNYPAEIVRQDASANVYIGGQDVDAAGNGVVLQTGRIGERIWSYEPRPGERDELYAVTSEGTSVVGVVEYGRPWGR